MGYSFQIHLRKGVVSMTSKSIKKKVPSSRDPGAMPSDVKRAVVSIGSLKLTVRRTNEQIERAMDQGIFAEIKPGQAGL